MLATLALFTLLIYGYAFLAADAAIFGCSIKDYNKDPIGALARHPSGTLNIRHIFFRFSFFRELLSCYFCLGVWTGMAAHGTLVLLAPHNPHILNSYLLLSSGPVGTAVSFLVAAVLGGPLCYVTDTAIQILEKLVDKLEG